MSSNDAPTVSTAELTALVVSNHCANAATTLIIFESLITVGQEAKYFWSRKVTGAAILFYLNRYLTLISFIDTMFGYIQPHSERTYGTYVECSAMIRTDYILEMITYIPWAAFSAMRAFALCRNWPLSLSILGLSLVPVAVNLANFRYGVVGVIVEVMGCESDVQTPSAVTRRWMSLLTITIASRSSLILADFLLIAITWFGTNRAHRPLQLSKNTFAGVLLRDGIVYFVCLLVLNSVHLALTMLSQSNIPSLQNASFVAVFLEPLTTILVSRFLLHLQSVNYKALDHSSVSSSLHTSIVFSDRVLGSLDQSLSVEDFFRDDVEDNTEEI